MLVLSRRKEERIIIDNRIVVTVLAVEGDKVKLGIEAPRDIPVLREELWQAIRDQELSIEKLVGESESTASE